MRILDDSLNRNWGMAILGAARDEGRERGGSHGALIC